jgi:hypothetical protein
MSQSYCAVRISEHMARDANGTLICLSAPICRSGYQTYKASEVDPESGDDTEVDILRPVSEVTSPATIASFEGVDLTLHHPAKFVTPDTHAWSALGHAQNVRIGPKDEDGNVQLVADLFVKDKTLQEAIERGVRDLSCGYRYDLVELSDGTWAQVNIRGNHIAVVENGRAGTSKIMDSKDGDMDGKKLDRLCTILEKLLPSQSQDAECNCGGKSQHSDACPCYGKEAKDDEPWEEAEGSMQPEGNPTEESSESMSGSESEDETAEEAEAQYERAGGPERKLKGFTNLIPTEGSGKGGFVNPVAARDALQNLRNIRALVQRNGSDRQIRSYNAAVRLVKEQIALGEGFNPRSSAFDSKSRRRAESADFEARAARFHGRAIKLHAGVNTVEDEHRAEDMRQPEESFDEAVERVRQKQIARWTPKRRR